MENVGVKASFRPAVDRWHGARWPRMKTVVTSCSKDELRSDLWGLFNREGGREPGRTDGTSEHEIRGEGGSADIYRRR